MLKKKVAELNRRIELDGLYSRGIQEMDLGNWREARNYFQAIQSIESEFLETAKLLAMVEAEIKKAEEKQWQEAQVNNLYGQARDLVQARMWKDALKRLAEIRKLDVQFVDKDKIEQYAQEQATAEENQIERTNRLSALYAQAVELLHEKNYQAALEKWQEIEAIDPSILIPKM